MISHNTTADYLCFLGWIETFHSAGENDPRYYVNLEMLIATFTKRLNYLRTEQAEEQKESPAGEGEYPTDLVFED